MSRSLGSLPPEPAAETVASRLRAVAQFLRRALPLCQAHTVEFYTRGLWEQLVALSPETVLEALSGAGLLRQQRPLEEAAGTARPGLWDNCKFSNVFCENSQKLVNVQFFALAAKYHSLPSLEVCTPLDQMLGALSGKQHERCAANVSPSQRLVNIRKRKRRMWDGVFAELQMSSHAERAQQNAWRQSMSDIRKAQYEREERWRAESRDEQSKLRAEDDRWRQLADRRQELMLRLLEHQTDMLQRMVELQERQQEQRQPLQPLFNQQPSSPSSIASSPRRPRTRWGGLRPPSHSTPDDCQNIRRLAFNKS